MHVGPNAEMSVGWEKSTAVVHSTTLPFKGKRFSPYKRLVSMFCRSSLTSISTSVQLSPDLLNSMWEPLVGLCPISCGALKRQQCQSAFVNFALFMYYISVHRMCLSYDSGISSALVLATKFLSYWKKKLKKKAKCGNKLSSFRLSASSKWAEFKAFGTPFFICQSARLGLSQ